jgi:hypothetical protein
MRDLRHGALPLAQNRLQFLDRIRAWRNAGSADYLDRHGLSVFALEPVVNTPPIASNLSSTAFTGYHDTQSRINSAISCPQAPSGGVWTPPDRYP